MELYDTAIRICRLSKVYVSNTNLLKEARIRVQLNCSKLLVKLNGNLCKVYFFQ